MKFIKYFLISCISCTLFYMNVNAETTPNGVGVVDDGTNAVTLYCEYGNDGVYVLINNSYSEDWGNVEPDGLPFQETTYETLKTYAFMDEDEVYDCPKYIFGSNITLNKGEITPSLSGVAGFANTKEFESIYEYIALNVEKSSCEGRCLGDQVTPDKDYWECNYTGPSGNLKTKYDGLYLIYYPDGTFTETDANEISSFCPDIFYNPKTYKITSVSYDLAEYINKHNNYDPTFFGKICGDESDNLEYYCKDGNCNFENNRNINCEILSDKVNGVVSPVCSDKGIVLALRFIGYLLFVAKILIPIILIILGSIDFGKAVMASNQDAVTKTAKKFATRISAAVIVFLIPTVVNFVFDLVTPVSSKYDNCATCIFSPNKCSIPEKVTAMEETD